MQSTQGSSIDVRLKSWASSNVTIFTMLNESGFLIKCLPLPGLGIQSGAQRCGLTIRWSEWTASKKRNNYQNWKTRVVNRITIDILHVSEFDGLKIFFYLVADSTNVKFSSCFWRWQRHIHLFDLKCKNGISNIWSKSKFAKFGCKWMRGKLSFPT